MNKLARIIRKYIFKIDDRPIIEILKENGLVIGKGVSIQGECIIDPSHCWLITIGDNVTLAPRVHILAHDASTKRELGYTIIGEVIIKNNVFVGANTTILPNVEIGNNVIIGVGNTILTNSHNIDSPEWETKKYGIEIEDYVWISTNCMILPSCRHIGKGAVIGAGSVVVEDVPDFAVMSGNPAKVIKYRKCLHTNLVVESIHNGDLKIYSKIRKNKKRI